MQIQDDYMNQEDERKSADDLQMITNRVTKLKARMERDRTEIERLEQFA